MQSRLYSCPHVKLAKPVRWLRQTPLYNRAVRNSSVSDISGCRSPWIVLFFVDRTRLYPGYLIKAHCSNYQDCQGSFLQTGKLRQGVKEQGQCLCTQSIQFSLYFLEHRETSNGLWSIGNVYVFIQIFIFKYVNLHHCVCMQANTEKLLMDYKRLAMLMYLFKFLFWNMQIYVAL